METEKLGNFKRFVERIECLNNIDDALDLSEEQFRKVEAGLFDYDADLHLIKNRSNSSMNLKYFDGQDHLTLGQIDKDESKNLYKLVINKKVSEKGLKILSEIVDFVKKMKETYN